ncbi:hypothetical protein [Enterococcus sp. AZ126]|uniref:hypothetical protein n=1 Tax=Enterococcus sp. AZ126 TaxID=2774635 RepID=UPI003F278112
MNHLLKYSYKITTLSKVIFSPREKEAYFIDDLGNVNQECGEKQGESDQSVETTNSIRIIYPFSRYGMYENYEQPSERIQYYIPGSSMKGVLKRGIEGTYKLLVDDILVPYHHIILQKLVKVQYLATDEKKIKVGTFFKNIDIEMCQENVTLSGQLFSQQSIINCLKQQHKMSVQLLKQWYETLEQATTEKEYDATVISVKNQVKQVLEKSEQATDKYLLIVGGYKGLLLSHLVNSEKEVKSGLFVDKSTLLPYGMIEISEVRQQND